MPSTATLKEVSADGAGDEAVRTPVERDLLGIWQELLPRQEISTDQSFFALGGSEETAQQMFSLIRERFGVSVEPAVLTEAPTIGELAEHIDLVKWLLTPATPTSPDHDELVL
jgi:hypothetical protein